MTPTTKARLEGTETAEDAVNGADIVVLATSSAEPVIRSEWVKAGAPWPAAKSPVARAAESKNESPDGDEQA